MKSEKEFGEVMREARKEHGVTQSELARVVGISPEYCRAIEKGEYTASWMVWVKVCKALEIDIAIRLEPFIDDGRHEDNKGFITSPIRVAKN